MLHDKYKLIRSRTDGRDEKVDAILLASDQELMLVYNKCHEIYHSKIKKGYVESALICSDDMVKISEVLDLTIEVLTLYQEVFFDTRGFDKLSKVEHIDSVKDESEKLLKLWALGQGLPFLAWRLGGKVNTSPIDGLVEMFSTCMYKAKEGVYNSNATNASREAIKWTKMSTDIARLLKVWTLDSAAAKKDLELAIREVVPDFIGIDELLNENKNE